MGIVFPIDVVLKLYSSIDRKMIIYGVDEYAALISIVGKMIYPNNEDKCKAWAFKKLLGQKKITGGYAGKNESASKVFSDDINYFCSIFGGPENYIDIIFENKTSDPDTDFKHMQKNGILAGLILDVAIKERISAYSAFDILANKKDYVALKLGKDEIFIQKDSFFNNQWRNLKSVSHLWAAYVKIAMCNGRCPSVCFLHPDVFLKCDRLVSDGLKDGFEGFMSLADNYLVYALTYSQKNARKQSILEPKEVIGVIHSYMDPYVLLGLADL